MGLPSSWHLWKMSSHQIQMVDSLDFKYNVARHPLHRLDWRMHHPLQFKQGFESVYRGYLKNPDIEIVVKQVFKGSKQGKKEFASEVKIITRLRHRHLVRLLGWCKQQRDLLLVYEYLVNGSLDTHLFGTETPLAWPARHKIVLGVASALRYLHEEGEQYVIHRDIKSSNIMLDSNFIPKLGDFGLARLMDLEVDSRTTVIADTRGYLALECAMTGNASKESDIYRECAM
ncbi:L-type lectin-domain containing receptor kinase IX.1-like protein [Drosera capensis]